MRTRHEGKIHRFSNACSRAGKRVHPSISADEAPGPQATWTGARNDAKASTCWEEGTRGDTGVPGRCSGRGPTAWEQALLPSRLYPTCRGAAWQSPPTVQRTGKGAGRTLLCPLPHQQLAASVGPGRETPLTPALTRYLGPVLCDRVGQKGQARSPPRPLTHSPQVPVSKT